MKKLVLIIVGLSLLSLAAGFLFGVKKGADLAFEYYSYVQAISDVYVNLNDYRWAKKRNPKEESTFTLESRIDTALVGWSLIKPKKDEFLYWICCDMSYVDDTKRYVPKLVEYRKEVPTMLKSEDFLKHIDQYEHATWREQARKNVKEKIRLLDKTMQEFPEKSSNNAL